MWIPFAILIVGIATVLTLIIRFRVNAFVALISAALLVSLLSPGPWSIKAARVAEGFGRTATSIAIVIAFAAIIGKCLMDSGAADRIVRSFQRLLGQQRTSVALLASGYVLSIPVFFDTVFYLLIPLGRSMWRQLRRDYVLFVTAIAAGAVITHSIVPPTPGPLVMADTLNVDLGLFILVGAIIGIPMAVVALLICSLMNKKWDIPMRPYPGEEEPEPLPDDRLPGIVLSLTPILLPVILISANTFAQMGARNEIEALRLRGDRINWRALAGQLASADGLPTDAPARLLRERLPERLRALLADPKQAAQENVLTRVREHISQLVTKSQFATEELFAGLTIPADAQRLRTRGEQSLGKEASRLSQKERVERALDALSPRERSLHNWILLETAFPDCRQSTMLEKVAELTAFVGNPNFSLFLAAIVAMGTLLRWRNLSFRQLGQVTEGALMSAGIIILITAAGGAFGAVLRETGVQQSLEQLMGTSGGLSGRSLLVMGFLLASVMKVAQGSGTVSMITASSMMAAMGSSAETLGCHPVYLAVAIGCGSMCGSWMNDSGFWVYARMGGFTENETLKTWTLLLVLIGSFGLVVTVVASLLFPLV